MILFKIMNIKFDQFYTNPIIAEKLVKKIFTLFPSAKTKNFIEPSAGTGNFVKALKDCKIINIKSYDIDPKDESIIKKDYLKLKIRFNENNFIIGNPPFGYKAKLAVEFVNKGLNESNFVAMILPKTFKRYSIHKQIKHGAKLVYESELENDAFLVNNKAYNVGAVFQIWVNEQTKNVIASNKRILIPLENKNFDFTTFIHNNTKKTLKYFEKKFFKWDYAVARQGYYNYKQKIKNPKKLIKNRQYLFVKANNKAAKIILNFINYEFLANKNNTTILGFSNTDLIIEYKKILNYLNLWNFYKSNPKEFQNLKREWYFYN